jgi:hypothetical protein
MHKNEVSTIADREIHTTKVDQLTLFVDAVAIPPMQNEHCVDVTSIGGPVLVTSWPRTGRGLMISWLATSIVVPPHRPIRSARILQEWFYDFVANNDCMSSVNRTTFAVPPHRSYARHASSKNDRASSMRWTLCRNRPHRSLANASDNRNL